VEEGRGESYPFLDSKAALTKKRGGFLVSGFSGTLRHLEERGEG